MPNLDADVAIIGAGLGGVSTGALLAAKGLKVLLLEQAAYAGGVCARVSHEGYSFQAGGNILNGFELGGGHERVLAKLGLFITKTQLDPGFQIVLPNHRLNFSSDKQQLLAEFQREFSSDFAGLKNFWQTLEGLEEVFYELHRRDSFCVPHTLKEKYTYFKEVQQRLARHYKEYEKSPLQLLQDNVSSAEVKRMLDTLSFFYAQLPLEGCSSLFYAYLTGLVRRGIFYINGGIQELVNQLVSYIGKRKGEVRFNSSVVRITTEGRRAVGVILADGQSIRAKYIIANTTLWNLYERLLPASSGLLKKIKLRTEDITPQWVPFTVYLGVDEAVLPNEMREHVFLLNDYKKLGDVGSLFVSLSPKWDVKRAPNGKRALVVSCYLPYDSRWNKGSAYAVQKQRQMERIIDSLRSLIPFIDEGIEFKQAVTPLDFEKQTGRPQGIVTGLAATPSGFGFKNFSNYTHYKNLYIVGDTSFPGHGTNLVSISALNLARIITS